MHDTLKYSDAEDMKVDYPDDELLDKSVAIKERRHWKLYPCIEGWKKFKNWWEWKLWNFMFT